MFDISRLIQTVITAFVVIVAWKFRDVFRTRKCASAIGPEPQAQITTCTRFTFTSYSNTRWGDRLPSEIIALLLTEAWIALDDPRERLSWTVEVQLVSRRWRSIALSTPSLWAVLFIPTSKFVYGSAAVHRNLQRSGALALEVEVEFDGQDDGFDWPDSADSKIDDLAHWPLLLHDISRRIWKLHINIQEEGRNVEEIFSHIPKLPILTEFSMLDFGMGSKRPRWPYAASHFPKLLTLHLTFYNLDWSAPSTPWKNLTDLRIRQIDPIRSSSVLIRDIRTVLLASPRLSILEVDNQTIVGATEGKRLEPVVLNELKLLILAKHTKQEVQLLFQLIDAPGLETLKIEDGRVPSFSQENVSLRPQFPQLKTLVLQDTGLALEITRQLASSVHDLVLLGKGEAHDQSFSSLLSFWGSSARVLRLETLTTEGVSASTLAKLHRIRSLIPSIRKITVDEKDLEMVSSNRAKGPTRSAEGTRLVLKGLLEIEVEATNEIHREASSIVFRHHSPAQPTRVF